MICPVTHDEDCPCSALTGCLGLFVVGALCLWVLLVVWSKQKTVRPLTPEAPVVEKTEKPYAQFPKLSEHCETCKQCASPMNDAGEEQGLCEEGFRLLQEDMRRNVQ